MCNKCINHCWFNCEQIQEGPLRIFTLITCNFCISNNPRWFWIWDLTRHSALFIAIADRMRHHDDYHSKIPAECTARGLVAHGCHSKLQAGQVKPLQGVAVTRISSSSQSISRNDSVNLPPGNSIPQFLYEPSSSHRRQFRVPQPCSQIYTFAKSLSLTKFKAPRWHLLQHTESDVFPQCCCSAVL